MFNNENNRKMKRNTLYKIAVLGVILSLNACDATDYKVIENGLYISEAQKENLHQVTVDDQGGKTTVTVRAGLAYDKDVNVQLGVANASELETFNKKNGTAYVLLPDTCYTLSANNVVLSKGKV